MSERSHPRPGSAQRPTGLTQGRGVSPALRSRPVEAAAILAAVVGVLLVVALVATPAWARGGGPGSGGSTAAPQLPADFPADIPLPPGSLQGTTGSAGQWSVLLLVGGAAADVQRSTERFYIAHGFTRDGNAVVRRGPERITVLAAARDHSPAETNLTLGVTRSGAGTPTAPLVATIEAGHGRVSLSRARRSGLRVRFTAPARARSATLRAYRLAGGTHRLVGRRSAGVHSATNEIALDSSGIRRRLKPGRYVLEVVLRDGAGRRGPTASTALRVVR